MKSLKRKQDFQTADIKTEKIYEGNFLTVEKDIINLDNKRHIYDIVRHPGAAVIIPINSDGKIILIKQYRHAINNILYELPAGKIDEGEDPEFTAGRELQEEIQQKAEEITFLFTIYLSPGFSDELLYFYLAENLTPSPLPSDDGEHLDIVSLTLDKALELCMDGQIKDAKTIIGIMRYEKMVRS